MKTEEHRLADARYRVIRAGSGPALVLLHGFTGNADGWRPFIPALADDWHVIAPDLPGHGGTAGRVDGSLEQCAADLSALLDRLDVGDAVVLGYSLGGRTALTWARAAPERVRALALESASPGIPSPSAREERRLRDEALAASIEADGVEAFVRRWERVPLFASQKRLPADVRQSVRERRLNQSATGLAGSLRTMGAGVMRPLHDELSNLTMPVALLAGALDDKYCRMMGEMARRLPKATLHVVPDAGHAVHIERPDEWLTIVEDFLNTL